jgi:hypothetical protein
MARDINKLVAKIRGRPNEIHFRDLCKVCDWYFGPPRQHGGSHRIYKTPWPGDPRINIQDSGGKAKAYQVKQVLLALKKLEIEDEPE